MNRLDSMQRRCSMLVAGVSLAVGFGLLACQSAHAFALVPMVQEFAPSGRGANQAFRVENESAKTIAVQISMKTREMSPVGKEINQDAEDDFIVYPAQLLLKPKEVQTVRVKWIGNSKPDKELAYRIVAEQLPVNLSKEPDSGVKINIMTRYIGSVYIVPRGVKPEVILDLAEQRITPDGQRQLRVRLHNRGTRHVMLRDLKLQVRAGGQTVELGPEALKGLAGENLLAGGKRELALPWPADLPDESVAVTFQFAQRRD